MISPAAEDAAADTRPRAWWLLAVRAVVIALAAGAALYALRGVERGASSAALYRCPMHPEAVAAEASAMCPICGMALVQDTGPRRIRPAAPRTGRAIRRTLVEQVRAPAWVDANGEVVAALSRDDLVGLTAAQPAQFFAASAPGDGVAVAFTGETQRWDAATAQARFAGATATGPAAGSHGSLVIAALPRDLLVVPASAVLAAPDGPYVLVVEPHRLVRRAVELGRDHHGVIAVLGGLAEGDDVVIGDAFFVAAEQLLHPEDAP